MDTEHKETQILVPNSTDLQQPTKLATSPETSEQPQQREVSPPLNHICSICNRGFRSGQALGGHKSMHFRESEAIIAAAAATPVSRRDPMCCLVCGKDFFDKRLLFAHLRKSHSGNNSSNSSSTVSDGPMIDDGVDSGSSFDLAKSLPAAWPPTGKRKRRTAFGASSSDCSGSDEAAANSGLEASLKLALVPYVPKPEADGLSGLVMLAQVCAEEAIKSLIYYNKDYTKSEFAANKRRRMNDASHQIYPCNICGREFSSFQALGGHKSSHCKDVNINSAGHKSSHTKYKDMDREQSDVSSGSAEVRNERQSLNETAAHQCKTCKKIFQQVRPWGGHQRLHNKGPTEAPTKPTQQNSARRLLDFDLNETPTMEDEDAPSLDLKLYF